MSNQNNNPSYAQLKSASTRPFNRLLSKFSLPLLVFFTTLLSLLLGSSLASADSPTIAPHAAGTISGKVTSDDGEPLVNIRVVAIQFVTGYEPRVTTTANDGTYQFPVLATGLYRLSFSDPSKRFAPEYFDNTTQLGAAKAIAIAGNSVANLDVALSAGGEITGTLALTRSRPISSVTITVYDSTAALQSIDSIRIITNPVSYTLRGLATGLYRVCANAQSADGEFKECYDNLVADVSRAKLVSVTAGTVTPAIDFVFGDGADMAQAGGRVTNAQGVPVAGIQVTAIYSQADPSRITFPVTTPSDADGNFHFNQLIPGIYTFGFVDPAGAYASHYLGGTVNRTEAMAISLAPHANEEGIEMQLVPGGQITGNVTVRGFQPDQILSLQLLWQKQGRWMQLGQYYSYDPSTGFFPIRTESGRYTITGLPAGVFQLETTAMLSNKPFNGASINPITLTVGERRSNIDIDLGHGEFDAALRGKVTGNGTPLPGIKVTLYQNNEVVYVFTDVDGNYAIAGLSAGDYRIGFSDPKKLYAFSFYDGYLKLNDCAWIHLEQGEDRTGIDATLASGGSIRGRVQRKDGTPVKGLGVYWLFERTPNDNVYAPLNLSSPVTITDDAGEFLLEGLPAHRYELAFVEKTYPPVIEYSLTTVAVDAGKVSVLDHLWGPDYTLYLPVVGR